MIHAAELKTIFEKNYNRTEWLHALREIFHIQNLHASPQPVDLPANDFDAVAHELGFFETSEGLLIGLFEVSISPSKRLERIKSGLRNLLRNVYKRDMDAALIVFTQGSTWRFSYASELTVVNKETGTREKRQTDPKRYTYLLGLGQHCRTAAERFASLKTTTDLFDTKISISEIEKAFSVDILTKDFYRELSSWYFWAINQVAFPDDDEPNAEARNPINLIRLITRLIFVWFLKQKKLVPEELFEREKIWPHLNKGYEPESTYYKAILQNLFFATLNQEMNKRAFRKEGQNYNVTNLFRYKKLLKNPDETIELFKNIPFLNGGLFECLDKPHPTEKTPQGNEKIVRIDGFSDRDDNPLRVPDYLFFGGAKAVDLSMVYDDKRQRSVNINGIIEILNSYNFTVEENTPLEIQVALDPELLGKVFENLLASYNPETKTTARKQTGSFYTPREIVNYMVDESLIAYLMQKLSTECNPGEEEAETMLRNLVSYSGNGNPFGQTETQCIVKAIDSIKVLDPACGSGAFPMGVLQQLVHVLQKLDPDNRLWKQLQMQRAQAELKETIDSGDTETFAQHLNEIADAFTNNAEDYGRKLYLIENCIYGVDIQPIAVQIAKLRFFISLLVDQTINSETDNLGIRALPNLETKFVAANTLIGLEAKMTLKPDKVYKLEKELERVRHRHFSARTPETKRKYRLLDRELRQGIAHQLIKADFPETDANKIAAWDPYDQNTSSPFFDRYWMFGLSEGFDVVIGNPPYGIVFNLQLKEIYEERYQTFRRNNDIYVAFFESGLFLSDTNGILCFITPNTFLNGDYFKSLRKFFRKIAVINHIVDFKNSRIFHDPTVFVSITLMQKIKEAKLPYKSQIKISNEDFTETENKILSIADPNDDPFKPVNFLIDKILEKQKTDFFLLEDKFFVKDVGFNYWTIGKGKKRDGNSIGDRIFYSGKKINPDDKPFLKGKNIERFIFSKPNNYLRHNFDDLLQPRVDIFRYSLNFLEVSKKIIYRQTSNKIIASLDVEKNLCDKTVHVILPKIESISLEYLLSLLNSLLFDYFYKDISQELEGRTFAQVKTTYIKKLPVKAIDEKKQLPFITLVNRIISVKKSNPHADTTALENRIDELVFKLYDLTYEEVKVMAPDFWLGEEEYESIKVE